MVTPNWDHLVMVPILGVDLGDLLGGDLVERIVFVHVDGQGVIADDDLLGLFAGVLLGLFDLALASCCGWRWRCRSCP